MAPHSAADDALEDIKADFMNIWKLKLEPDVEAALKDKFEASVGHFIRELEPLNPRRDLWHDKDLRELPDFVLGHVIGTVGAKLQKPGNSGPIGKQQFIDALSGVMKRADTELMCQAVVDSWKRKLHFRVEVTPICNSAPLLV